MENQKLFTEIQIQNTTYEVVSNCELISCITNITNAHLVGNIIGFVFWTFAFFVILWLFSD